MAVAGGDDATVLEALSAAATAAGSSPILVGPEPRIRAVAAADGIDLDGFVIRDAGGPAVAGRRSRLVRSGQAQGAHEGPDPDARADESRSRPDERAAHGASHLPGRFDGDPRDDRRFLLADTGICVQPTLDERIDILGSAVEVARMLGVAKPKVALMAATETVKPSMPETVEAAEIARRGPARRVWRLR